MCEYVAEPVAPDALARALVDWLMPEEIEPRRASGRGTKDGTDGQSTPPRWDRDSVLARLASDDALVAQMVESFRSDMLLRAEVLGKAVAANDPTSVHLHALSVQVAAARLGADDLEDVARRLDQAALKGDVRAALSCQAELAAAVRALAAALGCAP